MVGLSHMNAALLKDQADGWVTSLVEKSVIQILVSRLVLVG